MTAPKPSLDEVYQRWRTAHPHLTVYVSVVPDGWVRCRTDGCMILIAEDQERDSCYGHGGKPNVHPRPAFRTEDWRRHQRKLREGERLAGVPGRPYRP